MRLRNKFRKRAFTLMEVMAAVFVLALVAAFGATTVYLGQETRLRSNYLSKATYVAQRELEMVKALGYANLTRDQLYASGLTDSTTATAPGSLTWYFSNVDGTDNDSVVQVLPSGVGTVHLETAAQYLKRITVTVTWNDRGATRTYSTGTLVASL